MAAKAFLTQKQIQENIKNMQAWMKKQSLDAMYISSFDPFISEYVPVEECHRYYVTGFTGSVAESLVMAQGKVQLFVDGRYYEQADLEVDAKFVEVVKCPANTNLMDNLLESIQKLDIKKIGFESDRTPISVFKKLANTSAQLFASHSSELVATMNYKTFIPPRPVEYLSRELRGRDSLEKAQLALNNNSEAIFTAAIDEVAWITNCRGYHLPFLSSFMARAIITIQKIYVFISSDVELADSVKSAQQLEFIVCSSSELTDQFKALQTKLNLHKVYFDAGTVNCSDHSQLQVAFGAALQERSGGLIPWMSIKEPIEIEQIQKSFDLSNRAIFNTIKYVKEKITDGERLSELDLYKITSEKYREQGNIEHSFNTISGVGANSSIVHYGTPSDKVFIHKGELCLLDSGGYFKSGFATDTTRSFISSSDVDINAKYKLIYTLVLKGFLNAVYAVVPENTPGHVIDTMARAPLYRAGFNYNHGTGHGVGVHVHEGGIRFSSLSQTPIKPGQVVSIEPGIYIPGFGGVRTENVVLVEKHPDMPGFVRFKSFTWVGLDHDLIDLNSLNAEEKNWLHDYESECKKRGNSFLN
jgi:Xaa-Pro aminopeptidase